MDIGGYEVLVLGFTGEIDSVNNILSKVNSYVGDSVVQLLNADFVAGKKHIFHAVNQSILAFDRGENFANDLGVEICLRCSAQKQISKAFSTLGLKEGKMNLCAIVLNPNNEIIDYLNDRFQRNDDVLLPNDDDLMNVFNITSKEVASYMPEDIIIDKISKLSVDY